MLILQLHNTIESLVSPITNKHFKLDHLQASKSAIGIQAPVDQQGNQVIDILPIDSMCCQVLRTPTRVDMYESL